MTLPEGPYSRYLEDDETTTTVAPSLPGEQSVAVETDADPYHLDLTKLYGPQGDITPNALSPLLQGQSLPNIPGTVRTPYDRFLSKPITPTAREQEEISVELQKALEAIQPFVFSTEKVRQTLQRFVYLPEVLWLLNTPGAIENYQAEVYNQGLEWLHEQVEGQEIDSNLRAIKDVPTVDMFLQDFGNQFTHAELDTLITLWSTIPWGSEYVRQLVANGESLPGEDTRLFGYNPGIGNFDLKTLSIGANALFGGGAQDINNMVQDPREQVAAQAYDYMRMNPPRTLEERQHFMWRMFELSQNKVQEQNSRQGFWQAIGQGVSLPFQVASNDISQWFTRVVSPNEFAWRQHVSLGQSFAASIGIDPGESHYDNTSGAVDFALNLTPADPLNLIAGIGAGMSAARKLPKLNDISKARRIFQAMRPFASTGRNSPFNLPRFGRGMTARMVYSALARTPEQIVELPEAARAIRLIAQLDSPTKIAEKFPSLKNATGLVELMSQTDNVEFIKDMMVIGLSGGILNAEDTQKLQRIERLIQEARDNYKVARNEALAKGMMGLDDGIGIGQLLRGVDDIDGDVLEIAVDEDLLRVIENQGDYVFHGSTRTFQEGEVFTEGGLASDYNRSLGYMHTDMDELGSLIAIERSGLPDDVVEALAREDAFRPGDIERLAVVDEGVELLQFLAQGTGGKSRVFLQTDWGTLIGFTHADSFSPAVREAFSSFADQPWTLPDDMVKLIDIIEGLPSSDKLKVVRFIYDEMGMTWGAGAGTDLLIEKGIPISGIFSAPKLRALKASQTSRVLASTPLRKSTIAKDGKVKVVISRLNQPFKWLDLESGDAKTASIVEWLLDTAEQAGANLEAREVARLAWRNDLASRYDDAVILAEKLLNMPSSQLAGALDEAERLAGAPSSLPGSILWGLTESEWELLDEAARVFEIDGFRHGEGALLTRRGAGAMTIGRDIAENKAAYDKLILDKGARYASLWAEGRSIKAGKSPYLFSVGDMPRYSMARKVFSKAKPVSRKGRVGAFHRFLRRQGAALRYSQPGNISFTQTAEGSRSLKAWIKVLGGSEELAIKWSDRFRRTNPANRNRVIMEAMAEVGDEIDHPLLRENLITFTNKQGNFSYTYGRHGEELGISISESGTVSIKPLTVSHFAHDMAMPDAKELLRSIRRFGSTKRGFARSKLVRRGFGKTNRNREALARAYKRQAIRRTGEAIGLDWEDLMAVAYSDVLGSKSGTRPNGMGMVQKALTMAAKPLQLFHHVFTIAQLAGRPIAWSTRVLLEETVRANHTGLPSMWKNPKEYLNAFVDAHAIRQLPKAKHKQAAFINRLLIDIFDKADGDIRTLNNLKEVIPDIVERALQADIDPLNMGQLRAFAGHLLGRALIGGDPVTAGQLGRKVNASRRVLLRNRKIGKYKDAMLKRGLPKDFTFEMDAPDILNRSLFSWFNLEAESATVPLEWTLGSAMSPAMINTYGRAYGRQLYQMMRDPIVSTFGIGRQLDAARGGQSLKYTAENLVRTKHWRDLKPNIADAARYAGDVDITNEIELANWFLNGHNNEIVETLFSPLWTDAAGNVDRHRKIQVLEGVLTSKSFPAELGGESFLFQHTGDNYEDFVSEAQKFARAAHDQNVMLPPKLSAYFELRVGQRAKDKGFFRRSADWAMSTFGEQASQKLNRQAAYVHSYDKWRTHYLDELGWTKDAADAMAHEKAVEVTNYVFFNNADASMFLRRMNQVVPFFSAWWEVLSTWAYKIPSADFLPTGYAHLYRRVDRFMDGLVKMGIVSQSEDGQWHLNFADDLESATEAGTVTSKLGRIMLRSPVTIVEHLAALGRLGKDAIDGGDFSFDWRPADLSAIGKDEYKVAVGSPLDPQSHGVMAVNQWGFGLTPLLSFGLSQTLAKGAFVGDVKLVDVDADITVDDFLVANEIDFGAFLSKNRKVLEQAWGKETINRVQAGSLDPMDMVIPSVIVDDDGNEQPVTLKLPGSSMFDTLISSSFFPFGQLTSGSETITQVTPSTVSYILRGLGVMIDDDDPAGAFVTSVFGPSGQYQVDSEIATQIQHLEATEGLITQAQKLSEDISRLVSETVKAGNEIKIGGLEEGLPRILNPGHPKAEEAHELLSELSELNTEIVKRASDNAGWALIVRGMLGSLGPATPQMRFKEQNDIALYWAARNTSEDALARGSVNFANAMNDVSIDSPEDMRKILELTAKWLDDPVGDQAKSFLKTSYPSLTAFLPGKSFWGDGGPPPEARGIDEFFDQVNNGERAIYAPDVFMQKIARASVAMDREIAIIGKYGNDQVSQAAAILNDWSAYRDLVDEFDDKYEGLDWWDFSLNDGAYIDWQKRNPDDRLSFYELVKQRFTRAINGVDDVLNAVDFLALTPDERREIAGILKSSTRGIADIIREFDAFQQDDTYRNEREQIISAYFLEVADPFYQARTDLYDAIAYAETKEERSVLFDLIREVENDQWLSSPVIRLPNNRQLAVPNELLRAWNGKSDEDKVERKLRWVAQKPEWMPLQGTMTLATDYPEFANYVPTTPAQMRIYSEYAQERRDVIEFARANPEIMSEYERQQALSQLKDQLYVRLAENGRVGEIEYMEAWPIQRLAMANKLPEVLVPVLQRVNQVRAVLDAADGGEGLGPTSNQGRLMFHKLVGWLENEYFPSTPGAMEAFDQLGLVMFDEPVRATVYSKLLYGDFFGTLD